MRHRTLDEMVSYFNQQVGAMDIDQSYKIQLLGMVSAIAYGAQKPQWIPVTKKAHPDLPIRVQVQMDNGWIITAYYQEGEWLSVPDCGDALHDEWVVAWRELPEPWRRES